MKIREHRGFQIQVQEGGKGYIAEVYRKERLLQTLSNPDDPAGQFHASEIAIQAAKEWIERTYPKVKIRYLE
jgi:hypothetical protein